MPKPGHGGNNINRAAYMAEMRRFVREAVEAENTRYIREFLEEMSGQKEGNG